MEIVERHVTLPTDLGEAWDLLTDPDDLAAWMGREVGRRLAWRWWTDDDQEASRVEITLVPLEDGTEVRVLEELLPSASAARTQAAAAEAWSHRLLHLEALLLVAAAVRG